MVDSVFETLLSLLPEHVALGNPCKVLELAGAPGTTALPLVWAFNAGFISDFITVAGWTEFCAGSAAQASLCKGFPSLVVVELGNVLLESPGPDSPLLICYFPGGLIEKFIFCK